MAKPQDRALPRDRIGRRPQGEEFDKDKCLEIIFDKLATSDMGLHKIMSTDTANLPAVTQFWRWLRTDDLLPEGERKEYSKGYALAKRLQAEFLENQLLEIADKEPPSNSFGNVDSGSVQHSKLRIDTRKWMMARLHSVKYGDRTTLAGDPDSPLNPSTEDLSKLTDSELSTLLELKAKMGS